jgi:coproporphyrinogen III oxidase-like Fe-S oxidoreductase
VGGSEVLSNDQRSLEHTYLRLRTTAGLGVDQAPAEIVEKWRARGWVDDDTSVVRLTPQGWLRLDALVGSLTGRSNPC